MQTFRFWIYTLLGFSLVTLTANTASANKMKTAVINVGDSCLKMRSKASYQSRVQSCLPSGTQVQVLRSAKRNYVLVKVGNRTGYLHKKYLAPAPTSRPVARSSGVSSFSVPLVSSSSFPPPNKLGAGNLVHRAAYVPEDTQSAEPFSENFQSQMFNQWMSDPSSRPTRSNRSRSNFTTASLGDIDAPIPNTSTGTPYNGNDNDIGQLILNAARSVETDDIGRGHGYSLKKAPGWATLLPDGSITGVKGKSTHCTASVLAGFKKALGAMAQEGFIQLTPEHLKAINSSRFRDTFNSNGQGIPFIMQELGAEVFTDASQARPGDFAKLDRKNRTGHTVFVTSVTDDTICYWSGNRKTRGPGEQCEPLSRMSKITFARFTNLSKLQAGLDNLQDVLDNHEALADVRKRGGNGYVRDSNLTKVASVAPPAPIDRTPASLVQTVAHSAGGVR